MPRARGQDLKVNLYEESTYNTTPGAPSGYRIYVRPPFNVTGTRGMEQDPTLTGNREQGKPAYGRKNAGGPMTTGINAENIGILLKHLFGALSTSGAGPYTHDFTVGDLPVGFELEPDYGPNLTNHVLLYRGCRIASARFNFPNQGYPSIEWSVRGSGDFDKNTSPLDGTPTDTGFENFAAFGVGDVLEGGSSIGKILGAQLTISNELDEDAFPITNGGARDSLDEGQVIATGSLTAMYDDDALLDKAINGTESSLELPVLRGTGDGSAGNEYFKLNLAELLYEVSTPAVEGPAGINQELNFRSYKDDGAGISAQLKNMVATYP